VVEVVETAARAVGIAEELESVRVPSEMEELRNWLGCAVLLVHEKMLRVTVTVVVVRVRLLVFVEDECFVVVVDGASSSASGSALASMRSNVTSTVSVGDGAAVVMKVKVGDREVVSWIRGLVRRSRGAC